MPKEISEEKRLRNAAGSARYRKRRRERGDVCFQKWVSPEVAAKMQILYDEYLKEKAGGAGAEG